MTRFAALDSIKKIAFSGKFGQAGIMYSSLVLSLVVSVGTSSIITRFLGVELYGDYKFLINLFTMLATILPFGVFVAGSRMATLESRGLGMARLSGVMGVWLCCNFFFMVLILYLFRDIQQDLFNNQLAPLIILCLPFLAGIPLRLALENLLKGANLIGLLSLSRVLPGIVYLVGIVLFASVWTLNLESALLLFLGAQILVLGGIFCMLRPTLSGAREYFSKVLEGVKDYGFSIYVGSLFSTVSVQLSGLTIAFFLDTKAVGFFLLARTLSQPLTMLASVVGSVFFKSFATMKRIPGRLIFFTLATNFVAIVAYWLLIDDVVLLLYPKDFSVVADMALIMAFGAVVIGVSEIINNFLVANGHGRMARNAAFAMGIINMLGYTVLVFLFGVKGALITSVVAPIAHLLVTATYYRMLR